MRTITRQKRLWLATGIWLAGIVLFLGLGWWNIESSRQDAENRLISEAGRTAAQIAGLLELPGARLDQNTARALVLAAMEDERIYAIQITLARNIVEGLRRNYMWEPVPWDDEIAENCVQGMNPVRIGGQVKGKVDVWLSPRASEEEAGLLAKRERLRFMLIAGLWTISYLLLLWSWGDMRHFRNLLWPREAATSEASQKQVENIVLGLGSQPEEAHKTKAPGPEAQTCFVDWQLALEYQKYNPNARLVTSGLFRQTFGRAPALLSRLYAEGETAGLCHLGRMLEQAAPCIGARPLAQAAHAMQAALNDPGCETRALPVENCARVLEQTLEVLNGKAFCTGQATPAPEPEHAEERDAASQNVDCSPGKPQSEQEN